MTIRDENIAAISYGIAGLTNKAGLTLYEQISDEVGGEVGLFEYLVTCANAFSLAEDAAQNEFDWYLAIDAFVVDVVEAGEELTPEALLALATKSINANVERVTPSATA